MKKKLTIGDRRLHAVKKALLIMKLSFLLMLVGVLQVSAKVNGQIKVSLKLNEVEISRALNNIEKQSDYRFLYNSRLQSIQRKISIDIAGAEIKDVLNRLFTGTDLTYKLLENNLIVVLSSALAVQDITITGKVTGQNGEGLSNVSVYIKGTSKGTTTDNNGNFTLTVAENGTLVVSYIGYETQEVAVSSQSVVNLKLTPSTKTMDQVVVVGYGTQRKIDVTGAVTQIKGEEISKQPSTNAISGLQGKVAGVQITNNGAPGVSPQIRIRGLGTYWATASPLYVVDGVWFDDIAFLNPADIETFNILKDASSEAIYGIRGANGVILISTKKGTRNGKPTISYNGFVGYQVATNQPTMADANQYATLFNELGRLSNSTTFLDSSKFGKGTNWFDQTLRNAFIMNHQLSVAGGSEKSTYNFSIGYLDQDGILKTNNYQRYTARLQQEILVSKDIKVGYTAIGTYATSDDPPAGIWHDIYSAPPVLPVRFADGTYGDPGYYGLGQAVSNPQVSLDYNNAKSKDYHFTGSIYADVKFLKHFTFHSSLGGEYTENESKNYTPVYKATSTQQNAVSDLSVDRTETRQWILENTLTYSNTFGDHKVTALLGQNAQYFNYGELHGTAQNVPDVTTGNWFLGLGAGGNGTINDVDHSYNQAYPLTSTIASYFGRVNYSFKDRYLLTATIRADGSSKFQPDERWGYFPSIGVGWVISQESFMQNQNVFNSLKLKGSWGKVGNVGVPTFASAQQSISGGAYSVIYGNSGIISPGVSVASILPPALEWEVGVGTDVGLEAVLLNNRLSIDADYYNKKTQRIIMNVYLPGSAGLSNQFITTNVGDAQNQGFELAIGWKDHINKDFSYSIGGNIAVNDNKFLSNSAGTQKIADGGGGATGGQLTTITTVGQPIGVFYGYKVIGVFQNADEVSSYVDKNGNEYQPNAVPGDLKFASTTGAGPIGGNDRVVIGNPNPKYTYGINTYWAYKQFDLALDFNGVAGVDVYNANKAIRYGAENWTKDFYDKRWHGAGTTNSYPSVNTGGGDNFKPNSWYVEDGSYFRIRNIQLGYTFPNAGLKRMGIEKLRAYVNAQNPFTFFKYTGFTPEVGGSPGNAGIDTNVYPLYSTYNFGVNLTF